MIKQKVTQYPKQSGKPRVHNDLTPCHGVRLLGGRCVTCGQAYKVRKLKNGKARFTRVLGEPERNIRNSAGLTDSVLFNHSGGPYAGKYNRGR